MTEKKKWSQVVREIEIDAEDMGFSESKAQSFVGYILTGRRILALNMLRRLANDNQEDYQVGDLIKLIDTFTEMVSVFNPHVQAWTMEEVD
ncbi:hypothetical protein GMA3_72 [Gordonia phage GMA3]|uniref:Uncharacterized protein n=1 Tax=Gordonia phage GMA3 TaxID=1647284 RepID=A0A0K0NKY4_9CAUD|nr:hypothetical protein AU105_gp072 [Gordonia phage GMA3]AKL88249.1 hypothetical protein GMA3_72 [Gordonia phage GMA3]